MGMGGCNVLLLAFFPFFFSTSYAVNWKLFREYIGAESDSIKLADVPINPEIDHHFILAFAVDYTTDNHRPSPTDGQFNVFWDTTHLGPSQIAAIKDSHPNVKVAVSLGGDSIGHGVAYFAPESPDSWVRNAVSSLTSIIKTYNLDGIDVDYEHFKNSNPEIFAECIGRLVTELKNSGAISFASIAPFDDDGEVQCHYAALWRNYGDVIDYVNFQFYAYDKMGVSEFVRRFEEQGSKYGGGRILASFQSGGGGGLGPDDGFLEACKVLEGKGKLGGIFVWCADESAANGFKYEKASQDFLASA